MFAFRYARARILSGIAVGHKPGCFLIKTAVLTFLLLQPKYSIGQGGVQPVEIPDTMALYMVADTMPSFPGGEDSLVSYIQTALTIPPKAVKESVHGQAHVKFDVTPAGRLSNIQVTSRLGYGITDSLYRILREMPDWNPGIHKGNKVKVRVILPAITIDYEDGISLDSNLISSREEWDSFLENFMRIFGDYYLLSHREHSVFYDDALELMHKKNYSGAIKKLNNALVADPYDTIVLETRAMAYFTLNKIRQGCLDQRFASYLSEFSDTLQEEGARDYCNADYFNNLEHFLSDGMLAPPLMHNENASGENEITPPSYPGGLDSLYAFLTENFRIEKDFDYATQKSRVLVRFTVLTDGSLKFRNIIFDQGTLVDKEAYRLFHRMGRWIPARQNGQAVEADFIFPVINFKYRRGQYFAKVNRAYNEGVRFLGEKKYAEAIDAFSEALLQDSMDLDSHYNRGIAYLKSGHKENACTDWRFSAFYFDQKAIQLVNRFCDSILLLGADTLLANSFLIEGDADPIRSQTLPLYPGGQVAMQQFIGDHVKPDKIYRNFDGTIYIRCLVTQAGRVVRPKILGDKREKIDEEALRILALMPPFQPATKNDKPVDMYVVIEMRFHGL